MFCLVIHKLTRSIKYSTVSIYKKCFLFFFLNLSLFLSFTLSLCHHSFRYYFTFWGSNCTQKCTVCLLFACLFFLIIFHYFMNNKNLNLLFYNFHASFFRSCHLSFFSTINSVFKVGLKGFFFVFFFLIHSKMFQQWKVKSGKCWARYV